MREGLRGAWLGWRLAPPGLGLAWQSSPAPSVAPAIPAPSPTGCGGAAHWALEAENYEGWRVKVDEGGGAEGWLLLRPSLHDPGARRALPAAAAAGACAPQLVPPPWHGMRQTSALSSPPPPLSTSCTADIVLNVESEQAFGMRDILKQLLAFFREHPGAGSARVWIGC